MHLVLHDAPTYVRAYLALRTSCTLVVGSHATHSYATHSYCMCGMQCDRVPAASEMHFTPFPVGASCFAACAYAARGVRRAPCAWTLNGRGKYQRMVRGGMMGIVLHKRASYCLHLLGNSLAPPALNPVPMGGG